MKDLKNLFGAKTLSKGEQQLVKGGGHKNCYNGEPCPSGQFCDGHVCMPDFLRP